MLAGWLDGGCEAKCVSEGMGGGRDRGVNGM